MCRICPYVGTLTAKSGFFFLILKIIFWFFVTKHVPNVRSADVTITVASSKSLLRAAQPLCASVGWAEVVSAAISVPLTEKHAGGGICPSRSQLNQSWLWLHDFTLKSASSINSRDLQTFSSIQRLRRQYKLSPFSSCSFSLFFCFCVSHGGRSARRQQPRRSAACENWSGGWKCICAAFGQAGVACALRRYRMQRRRRGTDCRGAGWHRAASCHDNYSCTTVWVLTWDDLWPFGLVYLLPFLFCFLNGHSESVAFQ